jgi:ribokinase
LSDLEDEYNSDFIKNANILFLSNESIVGSEKDFIKKISETYNNDVIVIGMGDKGAMLYVKEGNSLDLIKAVKTRDIVNTIGAGDALFASFVHFYNKGVDPYESLKNAVVFASYKIGEKSGSEGFLDEESLIKLRNNIIS